MFNEALLIISLILPGVETPIAVVEIPQRDIKVCHQAIKDTTYMVHTKIKDYVKYQVVCKSIGQNS